MIRRVKLVHNLSAKIYNLLAAQRTIKHFQDHALLKAAEYISLHLMFRLVVSYVPHTKQETKYFFLSQMK